MDDPRRAVLRREDLDASSASVIESVRLGGITGGGATPALARIGRTERGHSNRALLRGEPPVAAHSREIDRG